MIGINNVRMINNNNNTTYGCENIDGTMHYYQSIINMPMVISQLSSYVSILENHINSSMRATAKEFIPEEAEITMNDSKNEVESDKVEAQEWTTPLKYAHPNTIKKNSNKTRKSVNNNDRYEELTDETE